MGEGLGEVRTQFQEAEVRLHPSTKSQFLLYTLIQNPENRLQFTSQASLSFKKLSLLLFSGKTSIGDVIRTPMCHSRVLDAPQRRRAATRLDLTSGPQGTRAQEDEGSSTRSRHVKCASVFTRTIWGHLLGLVWPLLPYVSIN